MEALTFYLVLGAWLFGMFQNHLLGFTKVPKSKNTESKSHLEQYVEIRQALYDLEKEIEKSGNKIVETGDSFELVSKMESVKIPAHLKKKQQKQVSKSETESV